MSTRTTCPGWPTGSSCGKEAGTAWTNTWCEDCDQKRRAHVAAACDRNILEPSAAEAVVVPPPMDYSMFCRAIKEQQTWLVDWGAHSPRAFKHNGFWWDPLRQVWVRETYYPTQRSLEMEDA